MLLMPVIFLQSVHHPTSAPHKTIHDDCHSM